MAYNCKQFTVDALFMYVNRVGLCLNTTMTNLAKAMFYYEYHYNLQGSRLLVALWQL